ncbi:MAG: SHOCT domain-containing protein [Nitrospira sp.]
MSPASDKPCFSCDGQRLVKIVPLEKGAEQKRLLHHPLLLQQQEWESLLRMVKVRSIHRPLLGATYQGDTEPLFSEEEVRYLGDSLQRAFQQATPQEQVVFALARPSQAGLDQVTSGVWFAEEGRIHLRVANCLVAVTMPSIRKQIWRDPLFAQAGAFYEFVPGDGQSLTPSSRDRGNPFRGDPDELVIEYKAAAGARPDPVSSESSAQPVSPGLLEEQLSLLKRLREQGLITEEDYRLKKQQLLDRL